MGCDQSFCFCGQPVLSWSPRAELSLHVHRVVHSIHGRMQSSCVRMIRSLCSGVQLHCLVGKGSMQHSASVWHAHQFPAE